MDLSLSSLPPGSLLSSTSHLAPPPATATAYHAASPTSTLLIREYRHGALIFERVVPTKGLPKTLKIHKKERVKAGRAQQATGPGETIFKGHRSYDLMMALKLGIFHSVGVRPARGHGPVLGGGSSTPNAPHTWGGNGNDDDDDDMIYPTRLSSAAARRRHSSAGLGQVEEESSNKRWVLSSSLLSSPTDRSAASTARPPPAMARSRARSVGMGMGVGVGTGVDDDMMGATNADYYRLPGPEDFEAKHKVFFPHRGSRVEGVGLGRGGGGGELRGRGIRE